DLYPQVPAELDDGVGQQRDGVVPAQVGGEGRDDLDRAHAHLTQVRKGGITHAVVADGQRRTESTRFGQTGDRLPPCYQAALLAHLQREDLGGQTRLGQGPGDRGDKT